ncbi:hypothetical protein EST38_g13322 [Candolleomyces aberdarensis]|uniref:Uncharacterized protein n=1 Tax=Candolleomyces aberdarensis TaxID=2316362 RepID=A0A4Q2D1A9_9AGAR|nr:hypothetical protein EST38_g13322 [Candolleomyces aberdarensis]
MEWTNNMLGVKYAKDFDQQMHEIAASQTWALYIDDHNLHLTFDFINYCQLN